VEERAWEVFVPHSTELLGVNAEAIGETDERAGHSQLVRAAASSEVQEVYTRANSPLYGFFRLRLYGQWTRDLSHDASPSAVEAALEALGGVGDVSVQSELLPDDHFSQYIHNYG
ncbi:unnamed protein product, partial [Pelagomonas calceolata]